MITVFEDFMDNNNAVWVSNLYLRLDGSTSRAVGVNDTPVRFDTSVFFVQNADMYLTHVVMRGLSDLGFEGRGVDIMDPPSWGHPGTARLYARGAAPRTVPPVLSIAPRRHLHTPPAQPYRALPEPHCKRQLLSAPCTCCGSLPAVPLLDVSAPPRSPLVWLQSPPSTCIGPLPVQACKHSHPHPPTCRTFPAAALVYSPPCTIVNPQFPTRIEYPTPPIPAECHFGNFMKTQGSALRLQAGNRATLHRCTFYDNYLRPGDTDPEDAGPAIAAVSKPHKPDINPTYAPAGLWLHSCDFRNNTPAALGPVAVNGSAVHSNIRAPAVVNFAERTVNEPSWLRPRSATAAVAGAVWDSSSYPTERDAWFQQAVQVRPRASENASRCSCVSRLHCTPALRPSSTCASREKASRIRLRCALCIPCAGVP